MTFQPTTFYEEFISEFKLRKRKEFFTSCSENIKILVLFADTSLKYSYAIVLWNNCYWLSWYSLTSWNVCERLLQFVLFCCAIVLFDPVVIDVFVDLFLLFIVCCQTNRLEMMKCHKFIDVGADAANNIPSIAMNYGALASEGYFCFPFLACCLLSYVSWIFAHLFKYLISSGFCLRPRNQFIALSRHE